MAKKLGGKERGAGKRAGGSGKGPKIVLALLGFVVMAIGVNMRRFYGVKQAKAIREMQQKREGLVSEQYKLQEAIRVASDRNHIIEIAQSRLGMKMPELSQVIDLPRRPLVRGRDSLRP
jgi:cell division protein FtsL